jgi:hypothetical protein
MKNPESVAMGMESAVTRRRAGELLPIDPTIVMAEQLTLLRLMVPEKIRSYVDESMFDLENSVISQLFERWISKYSVSFRDYCNSLDPDNDEDRRRAERLVSGQLTSEDYESIERHITNPRNQDSELGFGGPFLIVRRMSRNFSSNTFINLAASSSHWV